MEKEKNKLGRKKKDGNERNIFKEIWILSKGNRIWLYLTIVSAILNAAFDIVFAYALKPLVDNVLLGDFDAMMKGIQFMLALIPIGFVIIITVRFSSSKFTFLLIKEMQKKLSVHMQKFTSSYMEKTHTGDLMSKMSNNIGNIESFFENNFYIVFYTVAVFVGSVIVLSYTNFILLLTCLIIVPIMFWFTQLLSKPITALSRQKGEELSKSNAIAQDSLSGITMLKAFSLKKILYSKYAESLNQAVASNLKIAKKLSFMHPVRQLSRMMPFLICVTLGGYFTYKGEMSKGELILFLNLIDGGVARAIYWIPNIISTFRNAKGSFMHLFTILDEEIERENGTEIIISNSNIPIALKNVTFAYSQNTDHDLCDNIINKFSLTLKRGQVIALVGSSGCGKSTIMKLITGMYEWQEGDIEIFGQSLKASKLSSVREVISMVTQDSFLFPTSIEENIAYGKPGASTEEVIEAAKVANAHSFIMGFSEGYKTLVGERGVKLSGGQRQRVAIARALLKNAPVLLMDEPTSALDTESENLVQDALDKIMINRSVIVIAHRLSTIKNADLVMVMDQGKVVEQGTHEELLKQKAFYSQLYLKQYIGGRP